MTLLMFKALSDQTRLRLVHILFHYELSVNELVRILDMGQSRVSRHLKILAAAGLLRFRRDGLWVFYSTPASGESASFLRAIMPFFEKDRSMREDLNLAGQILEERSRKTRHFFNSIAENWDDLNREVLEDFDLPAAVRRAVPDDCNVAVDLGCGTGAVLEKLLDAARLVIGVDGSARMLELSRERLGVRELASGRVSLRIGELSHLPLADHEANFACINLVLHHLARTDEIFSEIQRILAYNGTLFIADFLRHDDETMRIRYGDHWLGFDEEDLGRALESAGLMIVQSERRAVGRGLFLMLLVCKHAIRKN